MPDVAISWRMVAVFFLQEIATSAFGLLAMTRKTYAGCTKFACCLHWNAAGGS